MSKRFALQGRAWVFLLVVLGLLGQCLILANSGYFSHDELQWAAFADTQDLASLPWVDPLDLSSFQYRPLTFNLWLVIGHYLFAHPHAYHALWVILGIGNGLLLYAVLRKQDLPPKYAFAAALVFLLNPYSAYVHGWVATLADLLWLGAMLGIALISSSGGKAGLRRQTLRFMLVFCLTLLALMGKEAAIVIPAVCGLCWVLSRDKRHWLITTLASALPVCGYLLLRMNTLADIPQGSSYAWQLANIPQRWLEYHLFAFLPSVFEPLNTMAASPVRLAIAALLCLVIYLAAFKAHWRLGIAMLVGSLVILGPVLVLGNAAGQYGYGFGALVAAVGATTAMRLRSAHRWQIALFAAALALLWHGLNVQRLMRHVGMLESRFSPQLAALVSRPAASALRLRADGSYDWAYQRLSHEIPSYRGVPHRRKAEILGPGQAAEYAIEADGSIRPLRNGE
ncbi:MAG TPA: hypothetical protein VIT22_08790 [Pseudoxanthomonas sp.]